MKIEIEGTHDDIMSLLLFIAKGAMVGGLPATTTIAFPAAPLPGSAVTADGRPEVGVEAALTGKPAPEKTAPVRKARVEKPAPEKTAEPEAVKVVGTEAVGVGVDGKAVIEPGATGAGGASSADTKLPAESPAAKPEPVKPESPKKAGGIAVRPDGWETWSNEKRRDWVTAQPDLAPSHKFVLLQYPPAPDVDTAADTKPETAAPTAETPAEKPADPGKDMAAPSTVALPDWGKWSLAKRIVWITSQNAADTDRIVELLGFRKEVGDVTEDNLQVARRKLQIAMRMREQVETGKAGK